MSEIVYGVYCNDSYFHNIMYEDFDIHLCQTHIVAENEKDAFDKLYEYICEVNPISRIELYKKVTIAPYFNKRLHNPKTNVINEFRSNILLSDVEEDVVTQIIYVLKSSSKTTKKFVELELTNPSPILRAVAFYDYLDCWSSLDSTFAHRDIHEFCDNLPATYTHCEHTAHITIE